MRFKLLALIVVVVSFSAAAQVINTYAGGVVLDGQPATSTPLNVPTGLAVDFQGNLFITEKAGGLVRRVDVTTGIVTIIAGGGTQLDDAQPIPGRQASLDGPAFGGVDGLGNFYFCDTNNHRIRKITPDGMIATVVGTGIQGFSGDGGPGVRAQLSYPFGIFVDTIGNLWISDTGNNRVRRVDANTGNIQTIAGGGTGGPGAKALEIGLRGPAGLTLDRQGNLLVLARWPTTPQNLLFRIDSASEVVTVLAGGGGVPSGPGFGQVPTDPKTIEMCGTQSVGVDPTGNLYFDHCYGLMQISAADGLMRQFLQNTSYGGQIVVDRSGKIYAVAARSGLVYRADPSPKGTVVAGTTDPLDGLFANAAVLGAPTRLSLDSQGNLYIADNNEGRVRRVDAKTGIITTAVTGGDVRPVHVDRAGNLFYGSSGSCGICKLDAVTGMVTALVGSATSLSNVLLTDGMRASDGRVIFVESLTSDLNGNLYFTAGEASNRVWMVEASTGLLRLIAGNGTSGNSGDGGPAKDASLARPQDLALDGRGNLLVSCRPGTMRQVNLASGIISAVGNLGGTGGVAIDDRGNIYVSSGHQVGLVLGGKFVPIAGTGQQGFYGDGGIPALAKLSNPEGLAVDADGSLYIADRNNARVRKVTALAVTPVLAARPSSLIFTVRQGQAPPSPQTVAVTGGNLIPLAWTATVTTTQGGNWLAVTPSSGTAPTTMLVAVNPAGLTPGSYSGAISIVSSGASGSPQTISVTMTVLSTNPPAIGLSQQFLSFTALQGGSSPPSQSIALSNTGGGTLSFAVRTETSGGGSWLQVNTSSGTAPATLTVQTNAVGLGPGLYQGQITLTATATNEVRVISLSMLISRSVPILQVSQTGVLMLGVEGSLALQPQKLVIQNRGQGVMNWQISASIAGAGNWLRVSPTSGTSDADNQQTAPTATVTVDPTQLRAGVYSGLLTITAEGAPNSPFVVLVLVSMQPAGSQAQGLISPAGLIFTSPSGSTAPLVQQVTVSTTGGQQLQFLAGPRTQTGGSWLSLSPTNGTLQGSTDSVPMQVTANPTGLAPGVYLGAVTVAFGNGLAQDVAIALVVTPPSSSAQVRGSSAVCVPSKLVMVETQLLQNFQTNLGWPTALLTQIANDCGTAVTDATVLSSFSNGDAPMVLNNLRNGLYSATWVPTNASSSTTLTLNALHPTLGSATVRLSGSLASAETPIVFHNGAVSGASYTPFAPLALGTIFSVFGRNIERTPAGAVQTPLPTQLGDTSVKLGTLDVPLVFVGPGQINAQVPYELPTGTTVSLVVKKGNVFTTPEVVTIVASQPAIFTIDQSGTGQGAILDTRFRLVDAANAATAGDVIQVYATGLGPTNPTVKSGVAAPSSPPAQATTAATATIGGIPATVQFAGLSPGFVGLYQVNVQVPIGVAPAGNVPLVITQSGIASNTATLAIK